jgi:hypothetical protein
MDRSLLPVRRAVRPVDLLAAAIPPAIVLLFLAIFLLSPSTYLTYILEHKNRELQAVEIITFTSAFGAAFILFGCAMAEWWRVRREGGSFIPGGALLIGVVGLAALFLGGEEISWGQTFFKWQTPDSMSNLSRETNLHNGHLGLSVHSLGNLFIVAAFIVLPLAWSLRHYSPIKLPADWRAGVAEWPVALCTLLAMAMRAPKQLRMNGSSEAVRMSSPFFRDYLDEISEQKEMLIAIAMLIYAIYRIAAVRRERAATTADAASTDAR